MLQAWIVAIKRDDWEAKDVSSDGASMKPGTQGPSRYSIVCAQHFDASDYPPWTYHGTVLINDKISNDAAMLYCSVL